jgi:ribonuclease Z
VQTILRNALRAALVLAGLVFVVLAAGFLRDPLLPAARLGVAPLGLLGQATLRGDFFAFFAVGGLLSIAGALRSDARLLLAPLLLISFTLAGRLITVAVAGFDPVMGPPMAVETVMAVLLLLGRRSFRDATPRRAGFRAAAVGVGAIILIAVTVGLAIRTPAVSAFILARTVQARLAEPIDPSLFDGKALRLILCGTSSPLPDPNRAKACAIVIAGERAFVVDTGPESWKTLALMGFPGERIAGVLLTHFHSDHIGDLGEFRLQTWIAGRKTPLPVYGGSGVEQIVAGFNTAYAQDDVYRSAHHGNELVPLAAAPLKAAPFRVGMSGARDQSEQILADGDLVITAFEVNHEPVRPAVGYRFDYKGRSIFISGDTSKWPNVAAGARDADVLVHEAQSQRMRQIYADAAAQAGNPVIAKIMTDIENYHASPRDAAEVANDAMVKLLVYTHFIPQLAMWFLRPLFFEGVSDVRPASAWAAGFDGYRVDLPIGSDAVIQGEVPVGLF